MCGHFVLYHGFRWSKGYAFLVYNFRWRGVIIIVCFPWSVIHSTLTDGYPTHNATTRLTTAFTVLPGYGGPCPRAPFPRDSQASLLVMWPVELQLCCPKPPIWKQLDWRCICRLDPYGWLSWVLRWVSNNSREIKSQILERTLNVSQCWLEIDGFRLCFNKCLRTSHYLMRRVPNCAVAFGIFMITSHNCWQTIANLCDITLFDCVSNVLQLPKTAFGIMMTPSNGNIFRVTGPLWGESTGQRGALMFSLIL